MPVKSSVHPIWPRILASLLICILIPTALQALAQDAPQATRTYTGAVTYERERGGPEPLSGVTVRLYGVNADRSRVLLDTEVTTSTGNFTLETRDATNFDHYVLEKQEKKGFIPAGSAAVEGTILDASTLAFEASKTNISGVSFQVKDNAIQYAPPTRRYLIVTSQAVVPGLSDFIAYKESLGFEMIVKTVEELDPSNLNWSYRRTQIRNYERTLLNEPDGLEYVLLIGTHTKVPFMTYNPGGKDLSRVPASEYPEACEDYPQTPNNCGWAGDWYYVDLTSNWDSNNDGILGEGFWADPADLGFTPDLKPNFFVDVYLGRLMTDDPGVAHTMLDVSMGFERDNGPWKANTLLAGSMMSLAGQLWTPADDASGHYVAHGEDTDTAVLLERMWDDYLRPAGFSRTTLYEKGSPAGITRPPSAYPSDYDLTKDNFTTAWTAKDYGFVAVMGHGDDWNIYRTYWGNDYAVNQQIDIWTEPLAAFGNKSTGELTSPSILAYPAVFKPSIFLSMACSIGFWANPYNMETQMIRNGQAAAWIGATSTNLFDPGWSSPSDFGGATAAYYIGEKLLWDELPVGEAVWKGLHEYYATHNGPNWNKDRWDWGYINYDLFGDPSLKYWGSGHHPKAAWPTLQFNAQGRGENGLLGPDPTPHVQAIGDLSIVITRSAPVIDGEGRVYIGDGGGTLSAFSPSGGLLWSYASGNPIKTTPVISHNGTIYVHDTGGKLSALTPEGSLLWSVNLGEAGGGPRLGSNGLVYVGGSKNDGPGGSTRYYLWTVKPNGEAIKLALTDSKITTTPVINAQGQVYFGTNNGTVYKHVKNADGEIFYQRPVTPGSSIADGLALINYSFYENVVIPSFMGELVIYDIENGFTEGTFSLPESGRFYAAPVIDADNNIYIGDTDGMFYSLTEWGQLNWSYDTGGPIYATAALDPLRVYVVGGSPSKLFALRRYDGTLVWSVDLGGNPAKDSAAPAIGFGRQIFTVGSIDGVRKLVKVSNPQWTAPPYISGAKAITDGAQLTLALGDSSFPTSVSMRKLGQGWTDAAYLPAGTNQATVTGLEDGQVYEFRAFTLLEAKTSAPNLESSDYSAIVAVQVPRLPPATPKPATVSPLSSCELKVAWPAVSTASSYNLLHKGPGDLSFRKIATVAAGITEYIDAGLQPNTSYAYQLEAANEGGTSARSTAASGKTLPQDLKAPRLVTAEALSDHSFRVCWASGDKAAQTVLARLPMGQGSPEVVTTLAPGVTCFTDQNAYKYVFQYQVRHRSVDGLHDSDWATASWVIAEGYTGFNKYLYLPAVKR